MGYKLKPNKAVAKRFKVTAKGKLKRHHTLTSHLRSARTAKKKRHLRRPEITFEGIARNMRVLMGVKRGLRNKEIAFELGLSEKTIKAYLGILYRKLGVNNRTQAVILLQEVLVETEVAYGHEFMAANIA